jgi:eukaryotic-like serine/threonine-protein kinase
VHRLPKQRGVQILLVMILALLAAGCAPRGGTVNAGWTVLTAEGERIYAVLASGEAVALEAIEDGDLLWRYPLEGAASGTGCGLPRAADDDTEQETPLGAVYGQPTIAGDVVLVGSFDGSLFALDRETGGVAWSYAVGAPIVGGVTVYDGIAYFGATDYQVYALDLASRQPVWETSFRTEETIWGRPAVDQERVYIGSMDHSVYAIDRESGQQIWATSVDAAIPGDVTLANGVVLAGGVDSRLHVLDAETGQLLWQTERLDGWVWGQPLVIEDQVFFTSLRGTLYGYSLTTREPLWPGISLEGSLRAGPILYDGRVVVGTDDQRVYLVDLVAGQADLLYGGSGAEPTGPILSAPVVADDLIFVGSSTGTIVALDPARRNPQVWVYPFASDN